MTLVDQTERKRHAWTPTTSSRPRSRTGYPDCDDDEEESDDDESDDDAGGAAAGAISDNFDVEPGRGCARCAERMRRVRARSAEVLFCRSVGAVLQRPPGSTRRAC